MDDSSYPPYELPSIILPFPTPYSDLRSLPFPDPQNEIRVDTSTFSDLRSRRRALNRARKHAKRYRNFASIHPSDLPRAGAKQQWHYKTGSFSLRYNPDVDRYQADLGTELAERFTKREAWKEAQRVDGYCVCCVPDDDRFKGRGAKGQVRRELQERGWDQDYDEEVKAVMDMEGERDHEGCEVCFGVGEGPWDGNGEEVEDWENRRGADLVRTEEEGVGIQRVWVQEEDEDECWEEWADQESYENNGQHVEIKERNLWASWANDNEQAHLEDSRAGVRWDFAVPETVLNFSFPSAGCSWAHSMGPLSPQLFFPNGERRFQWQASANPEAAFDYEDSRDQEDHDSGFESQGADDEDLQGDDDWDILSEDSASTAWSEVVG